MADVQPLGDPTPVLTLLLSSHPHLVLNLGRETLSSDPKLRIKRHEPSQPVTLLLDGLQGDDYGFDIVTALQHGLLQLLDADSGDVIVIPPSDTTPPRPRTIRPMEIDEVHTISFHPRHEFWRPLVRNGHRYLIGFSESGGRSWCQYGAKEEHLGHLGRDRPESLPLQRATDFMEVTVRDDPPPPTFAASLSTSSSVCHLSAGSPTFNLIVSVTSHETRPITVAMEDTPFHLAQGLDDIFEIRDQESDERLELPSGAGCFLDNTGSDDYPSRLILQDFLPLELYVRKYALEPFDAVTANGGELDCLREGHRYSVRPSRTVLDGFGSWCWGRKSELPGDAEEVRNLLRNHGRISFAVPGVPVIFQAEK